MIIIVLFIIKFFFKKNKIILYNRNLIFIPISIFLVILSVNSVNSESLSTSIELNFYRHFLFILLCFLVGVFEELLFRVFIFSFLRKIHSNQNKSVFLSLFFTSIIFGLVHMLNMLNSEIVKISVINQIFLAFSLGFLFQGFYLKFKNIFLIVTLHAMFNYLGMYKRQLFNFKLEDSVYTFTDFFSTFIFICFFFLIIVYPTTYFLNRKKLRKISDSDLINL